MVSFWMLTGCVKKSPAPTPSVIPLSNASLSDSISKLDSLVNVTKPNNYVKSFSYAKRALALGMMIRNPEVLAKAFILMGIVYTNKRNDSSYFYYSEAMKIVEKFKLSVLKPYLFYNFSTLYYASHDYKMTTVLLDSAIRFAVKEKDFVILSNTYNSLGSLKFDLHDEEGAKAMFDSSYKIAKKNKLFKQMGVSLGNLASFEPDPIKAIQIQKQAIGLLEKSTGTKIAKALILINIGSQLSNNDSSIKYYKSAIHSVDPSGSNEVKIAALNNMAYRYLSKKDYRNAENCLISEAIPIAEKENNFDWMSTLYDSYADVLKSQGRLDDAFTYEKKANKNRKEADKHQAADQVRLLGVLLDVKNKELKIQTIEKEIENNENRIQKMKLLFVSFLLLASGIVFITLWIIQRKKLKLQKQLVISAKRIIDAEENLKGRLAMELHDMVSPLYTQILRQIESTEIPDTSIKDELHIKLTQLADKIRQISHRMNKVFIEQLTFVELVKGACDDMQYLTDVPIKLVISKDPFDLTPEMGTHLFRIIQELLANAVKYVTTGVIHLSVSIEFQNLYIFYQDSGSGFDPERLNIEGIGLLNIVERAKLIGGEATLKTSPGNGTHWRICIPL
jgi:signal transduction histidine kinase